MAQWRPLEVHSVGGGLEGVNVEGARGVERVGAGEEFRGVGDAVAVGVERGGWRRRGVGGGAGCAPPVGKPQS